MKSSRLWKFYNCIYQDGIIDFQKSQDTFTLTLKQEVLSAVKLGLEATSQPDISTR